MKELFGGIEAGGTKFVCAVGRGPGEIIAETRFPTTSPDETLQRTVDFFHEHKRHNHLRAIGIACFGPLDIHPRSPTYGYITSTPKPGWANTDITGVIQNALELPVRIDTDVDAAALGEQTWGAGRGLENLLYLTIGTGIGGGAIANNQIIHGLVHPEMGHILIPHNWQRDPFKGICPYHADCFEGLASGPAIKARWGAPAQDLPPDHPAWSLEAHYLGLALSNFICTLSPQRIILGGGVMGQPQLLPLVRQQTLDLLNGYVRSPAILDQIDAYIVSPELGNQAGVLGAIALAAL
jgi:fructokinase